MYSVHYYYTFFIRVCTSRNENQTVKNAHLFIGWFIIFFLLSFAPAGYIAPGRCTDSTALRSIVTPTVIGKCSFRPRTIHAYIRARTRPEIG